MFGLSVTLEEKKKSGLLSFSCKTFEEEPKIVVLTGENPRETVAQWREMDKTWQTGHEQDLMDNVKACVSPSIPHNENPFQHHPASTTAT